MQIPDKKSLKIPKVLSGVVSLRRTDNAVTKRTGNDRPNIAQNIDQHEPAKNWR
jgi:hypothetical protein